MLTHTCGLWSNWWIKKQAAVLLLEILWWTIHASYSGNLETMHSYQINSFGRISLTSAEIIIMVTPVLIVWFISFSMVFQVPHLHRMRQVHFFWLWVDVFTVWWVLVCQLMAVSVDVICEVVHLLCPDEEFLVSFEPSRSLLCAWSHRDGLPGVSLLLHRIGLLGVQLDSGKRAFSKARYLPL